MTTTAANSIREQIVSFAALSKAPDGSGWKPLSPEYARRKQKLVGNHMANKRVTGQFLASVKNRNGIVAPDATHTPQGKGLEKTRVSFEVAENTKTIIEAKLLKSYNAAS